MWHWFNVWTEATSCKEIDLESLKTTALCNAIIKHFVKLSPLIIWEADYVPTELVTLGQNILKK